MIRNERVRGAPFKRSISFLLTITVLSTQTLFAHLPEKNVWDDRRRSLQKETPQLAMALPSLTANSKFQIPNSKQIQDANSQKTNLMGLSSSNLKVAWNLGFGIWDLNKFGTIRSIKPASSKNAPVVVLIQDIHGQIEPQKNIASMIAALTEKSPSALIGLEGSAGPIPVGDFRKAPANVTRELASFYLNTQLITGAEYAGMTAPQAPVLHGVEEADLYLKNVRAVRSALAAQKNAVAAVEKEETALSEEKRRVYSLDLWALDQKRTDYESGKLSIGGYLSSLAARKPADRFPMISLFLKTWALEKSLDFNQAETERNHVLARLVEKLSKADVDVLVKLSLALKAGELPYPDYYAHLKTISTKTGVNLDLTPSFKRYMQYVLQADAVKAEELLSEFSAFENQVWLALCANEDQRRVYESSVRMRLTDKLVRLSMTPNEWAEYKSQLSNPKSQTNFKNKNQHGLRFENPDFVWNSDFGNWDLKPFEDFYLLAEARNESISKNFLNAAGKSPFSVLVAGGFHSAALADLLAKENRTVVVVSPKLTKADSVRDNSYLSVFTQEKTPLEKLFEAPKISLVHTPEMKPLVENAAPAKNHLARLTDGLVDPVRRALATGKVVKEKIDENAVRVSPIGEGGGAKADANVLLAGRSDRLYISVSYSEQSWAFLNRIIRALKNFYASDQVKINIELNSSRRHYQQLSSDIEEAVALAPPDLPAAVFGAGALQDLPDILFTDSKFPQVILVEIDVDRTVEALRKRGFEPLVRSGHIKVVQADLSLFSQEYMEYLEKSILESATVEDLNNALRAAFKKFEGKIFAKGLPNLTPGKMGLVVSSMMTNNMVYYAWEAIWRSLGDRYGIPYVDANANPMIYGLLEMDMNAAHERFVDSMAAENGLVFFAQPVGIVNPINLAFSHSISIDELAAGLSLYLDAMAGFISPDDVPSDVVALFKSLFSGDEYRYSGSSVDWVDSSFFLNPKRKIVTSKVRPWENLLIHTTISRPYDYKDEQARASAGAFGADALSIPAEQLYWAFVSLPVFGSLIFLAVSTLSPPLTGGIAMLIAALSLFLLSYRPLIRRFVRLHDKKIISNPDIFAQRVGGLDGRFRVQVESFENEIENLAAPDFSAEDYDLERIGAYRNYLEVRFRRFGIWTIAGTLTAFPILLIVFRAALPAEWIAVFAFIIGNTIGMLRHWHNNKYDLWAGRLGASSFNLDTLRYDVVDAIFRYLYDRPEKLFELRTLLNRAIGDASISTETEAVFSRSRELFNEALKNNPGQQGSLDALFDREAKIESELVPLYLREFPEDAPLSRRFARQYGDRGFRWFLYCCAGYCNLNTLKNDFLDIGGESLAAEYRLYTLSEVRRILSHVKTFMEKDSDESRKFIGLMAEHRAILSALTYLNRGVRAAAPPFLNDSDPEVNAFTYVDLAVGINGVVEIPVAGYFSDRPYVAVDWSPYIELTLRGVKTFFNVRDDRVSILRVDFTDPSSLPEKIGSLRLLRVTAFAELTPQWFEEIEKRIVPGGKIIIQATPATPRSVSLRLEDFVDLLRGDTANSADLAKRMLARWGDNDAWSVEYGTIGADDRFHQGYTGFSFSEDNRRDSIIVFTKKKIKKPGIAGLIKRVAAHLPNSRQSFVTEKLVEEWAAVHAESPSLLQEKIQAFLDQSYIKSALLFGGAGLAKKMADEFAASSELKANARAPFIEQIIYGGIATIVPGVLVLLSAGFLTAFSQLSPPDVAVLTLIIAVATYLFNSRFSFSPWLRTRFVESHNKIISSRPDIFARELPETEPLKRIEDGLLSSADNLGFPDDALLLAINNFFHDYLRGSFQVPGRQEIANRVAWRLLGQPRLRYLAMGHLETMLNRGFFPEYIIPVIRLLGRFHETHKEVRQFLRKTAVSQREKDDEWQRLQRAKIRAAASDALRFTETFFLDNYDYEKVDSYRAYLAGRHNTFIATTALVQLFLTIVLLLAYASSTISDPVSVGALGFIYVFGHWAGWAVHEINNAFKRLNWDGILGASSDSAPSDSTLQKIFDPLGKKVRSGAAFKESRYTVKVGGNEYQIFIKAKLLAVPLRTRPVFEKIDGQPFVVCRIYRKETSATGKLVAGFAFYPHMEGPKLNFGYLQKPLKNIHDTAEQDLGIFEKFDPKLGDMLRALIADYKPGIIIYQRYRMRNLREAELLTSGYEFLNYVEQARQNLLSAYLDYRFGAVGDDVVASAKSEFPGNYIPTFTAIRDWGLRALKEKPDKLLAFQRIVAKPIVWPDLFKILGDFFERLENAIPGLEIQRVGWIWGDRLNLVMEVIGKKKMSDRAPDLSRLFHLYPKQRSYALAGFSIRENFQRLLAESNGSYFFSFLRLGELIEDFRSKNPAVLERIHEAALVRILIFSGLLPVRQFTTLLKQQKLHLALQAIGYDVPAQLREEKTGDEIESDVLKIGNALKRIGLSSLSKKGKFERYVAHFIKSRSSVPVEEQIKELKKIGKTLIKESPQISEYLGQVRRAFPLEVVRDLSPEEKQDFVRRQDAFKKARLLKGKGLNLFKYFPATIPNLSDFNSISRELKKENLQTVLAIYFSEGEERRVFEEKIGRKITKIPPEILLIVDLLEKMAEENSVYRGVDEARRKGLLKKLNSDRLFIVDSLYPPGDVKPWKAQKVAESLGKKQAWVSVHKRAALVEISALLGRHLVEPAGEKAYERKKDPIISRVEELATEWASQNSGKPTYQDISKAYWEKYGNELFGGDEDRVRDRIRYLVSKSRKGAHLRPLFFEINLGADGNNPFYEQLFWIGPSMAPVVAGFATGLLGTFSVLSPPLLWALFSAGVVLSIAVLFIEAFRSGVSVESFVESHKERIARSPLLWDNSEAYSYYSGLAATDIENAETYEKILDYIARTTREERIKSYQDYLKVRYWAFAAITLIATSLFFFTFLYVISSLLPAASPLPGSLRWTLPVLLILAGPLSAVFGNAAGVLTHVWNNRYARWEGELGASGLNGQADKPINRPVPRAQSVPFSAAEINWLVKQNFAIRAAAIYELRLGLNLFVKGETITDRGAYDALLSQIRKLGGVFDIRQVLFSRAWKINLYGLAEDPDLVPYNLRGLFERQGVVFGAPPLFQKRYWTLADLGMELSATPQKVFEELIGGGLLFNPQFDVDSPVEDLPRYLAGTLDLPQQETVAKIEKYLSQSYLNRTADYKRRILGFLEFQKKTVTIREISEQLGIKIRIIRAVMADNNGELAGHKNFFSESQKGDNSGDAEGMGADAAHPIREQAYWIAPLVPLAAASAALLNTLVFYLNADPLGVSFLATGLAIVAGSIIIYWSSEAKSLPWSMERFILSHDKRIAESPIFQENKTAFLHYATLLAAQDNSRASYYVSLLNYIQNTTPEERTGAYQDYLAGRYLRFAWVSLLSAAAVNLVLSHFFLIKLAIYFDAVFAGYGLFLASLLIGVAAFLTGNIGGIGAHIFNNKFFRWRGMLGATTETTAAPGTQTTSVENWDKEAAFLQRYVEDKTKRFFRDLLALRGTIPAEDLENSKGDDTPVTKWDKAAEAAFRQASAEEFPKDGYFGEEFENFRVLAQRTWTVDPIDGTRSFINYMLGRNDFDFGTIAGIFFDDYPKAAIGYWPALMINEGESSSTLEARNDRDGVLLNGKPVGAQPELMNKSRIVTIGAHPEAMPKKVQALKDYFTARGYTVHSSKASGGEIARMMLKGEGHLFIHLTPAGVDAPVNAFFAQKLGLRVSSQDGSPIFPIEFKHLKEKLFFDSLVIGTDQSHAEALAALDAVKDVQEDLNMPASLQKMDPVEAIYLLNEMRRGKQGRLSSDPDLDRWIEAKKDELRAQLKKSVARTAEIVQQMSEKDLAMVLDETHVREGLFDPEKGGLNKFVQIHQKKIQEGKGETSVAASAGPPGAGKTVGGERLAYEASSRLDGIPVPILREDEFMYQRNLRGDGLEGKFQWAERDQILSDLRGGYGVLKPTFDDISGGNPILGLDGDANLVVFNGNRKVIVQYVPGAAVFTYREILSLPNEAPIDLTQRQQRHHTNISNSGVFECGSTRIQIRVEDGNLIVGFQSMRVIQAKDGKLESLIRFTDHKIDLAQKKVLVSIPGDAKVTARTRGRAVFDLVELIDFKKQRAAARQGQVREFLPAGTPLVYEGQFAYVRLVDGEFVQSTENVDVAFNYRVARMLRWVRDTYRSIMRGRTMKEVLENIRRFWERAFSEEAISVPAGRADGIIQVNTTDIAESMARLVMYGRESSAKYRPLFKKINAETINQEQEKEVDEPNILNLLTEWRDEIKLVRSNVDGIDEYQIGDFLIHVRAGTMSLEEGDVVKSRLLMQRTNGVMAPHSIVDAAGLGEIFKGRRLGKIIVWNAGQLLGDRLNELAQAQTEKGDREAEYWIDMFIEQELKLHRRGIVDTNPDPALHRRILPIHGDIVACVVSPSHNLLTGREALEFYRENYIGRSGQGIYLKYRNKIPQRYRDYYVERVKNSLLRYSTSSVDSKTPALRAFYKDEFERTMPVLQRTPKTELPDDLKRTAQSNNEKAGSTVDMRNWGVEHPLIFGERIDHMRYLTARHFINELEENQFERISDREGTTPQLAWTALFLEAYPDRYAPLAELVGYFFEDLLANPRLLDDPANIENLTIRKMVMERYRKPFEARGVLNPPPISEFTWQSFDLFINRTRSLGSSWATIPTRAQRLVNRREGRLSPNGPVLQINNPAEFQRLKDYLLRKKRAVLFDLDGTVTHLDKRTGNTTPLVVRFHKLILGLLARMTRAGIVAAPATNRRKEGALSYANELVGQPEFGPINEQPRSPSPQGGTLSNVVVFYGSGSGARDVVLDKTLYEVEFPQTVRNTIGAELVGRGLIPDLLKANFEDLKTKLNVYCPPASLTEVVLFRSRLEALLKDRGLLIDPETSSQGSDEFKVRVLNAGANAHGYTVFSILPANVNKRLAREKLQRGFGFSADDVLPIGDQTQTGGVDADFDDGINVGEAAPAWPGFISTYKAFGITGPRASFLVLAAQAENQNIVPKPYAGSLGADAASTFVEQYFWIAPTAWVMAAAIASGLFSAYGLLSPPVVFLILTLSVLAGMFTLMGRAEYGDRSVKAFIDSHKENFNHHPLLWENEAAEIWYQSQLDQHPGDAVRLSPILDYVRGTTRHERINSYKSYLANRYYQFAWVSLIASNSALAGLLGASLVFIKFDPFSISSALFFLLGLTIGAVSFIAGNVAGILYHEINNVFFRWKGEVGASSTSTPSAPSQDAELISSLEKISRWAAGTSNPDPSVEGFKQMLIFGSESLRVAAGAADLWNKAEAGKKPMILVSGGVGPGTRTIAFHRENGDLALPMFADAVWEILNKELDALAEIRRSLGEDEFWKVMNQRYRIENGRDRRKIKETPGAEARQAKREKLWQDYYDFTAEQLQANTVEELVMSALLDPKSRETTKIPEGMVYRAILIAKGIPSRFINVEAQSTTTVENIRFIRDMIKGDGDVAFVHKTFQLRRAGFSMQEELKRAGVKARLVGMPPYQTDERYFRTMPRAKLFDTALFLLLEILRTKSSPVGSGMDKSVPYDIELEARKAALLIKGQDHQGTSGSRRAYEEVRGLDWEIKVPARFYLLDEEKSILTSSGQKVANLLSDRSVATPGGEKQPLTNYGQAIADHRPEALIVFGVGSTLVAERAADMVLTAYRYNSDIRVVFTGGVGRATPDSWLEHKKPEAEVLKMAFLNRLRQLNSFIAASVEQNTITENQSTDSGENVLFTSARFNEMDFKPKTVMLVQSPILQLRSAFATWMRQAGFSDTKVVSFSPYDVDLLKLSDLQLYAVAKLLLGELARLRDYPAHGFTIPVDTSSVQDEMKSLLEVVTHIERRLPPELIPDVNAVNSTILKDMHFGKKEAVHNFEFLAPDKIEGIVKAPADERTQTAYDYGMMRQTLLYAKANKPDNQDAPLFKKLNEALLDAQFPNGQPLDTDIYSLAAEITSANPQLAELLSQIVDEWVKIIKTKKHFIADPKTYHVSVSVAQNLAEHHPGGLGGFDPHAKKLEREELINVFKEIRRLMRKPLVLNLKPVGIRSGEDGALVLAFEYDEKLYGFRKTIGDWASGVAPNYKDKTPRRHVFVTLFRSLEQVFPDEDMVRKIQAFEKRYADITRILLERKIPVNVEINRLNLSHETKWMHGEIQPRGLGVDLEFGAQNDAAMERFTHYVDDRFYEDAVLAHLKTSDDHQYAVLLNKFGFESPYRRHPFHLNKAIRDIGHHKRIKVGQSGWKGFYPETDRVTGKPTGRIVAFQKMHAEGIVHATSEIILITPDKRVLIQESRKGIVDWSATGHVEVGQTPEEAAISEANEELDLPLLGITLNPALLRRIPSPGGKPFFYRSERKDYEGATEIRDGVYHLKGIWDHNEEQNYSFGYELSFEVVKKILLHFDQNAGTEEVKRVRLASLGQLARELDGGTNPGLVTTSGIYQHLHDPVVRQYFTAAVSDFRDQSLGFSHPSVWKGVTLNPVDRPKELPDGSFIYRSEMEDLYPGITEKPAYEALGLGEDDEWVDQQHLERGKIVRHQSRSDRHFEDVLIRDLVGRAREAGAGEEAIDNALLYQTRRDRVIQLAWIIEEHEGNLSRIQRDSRQELSEILRDAGLGDLADSLGAQGASLLYQQLYMAATTFAMGAALVGTIHLQAISGFSVGQPEWNFIVALSVAAAILIFYVIRRAFIYSAFHEKEIAKHSSMFITTADVASYRNYLRKAFNHFHVVTFTPMIIGILVHMVLVTRYADLIYLPYVVLAVGFVLGQARGVYDHWHNNSTPERRWKKTIGAGAALPEANEGKISLTDDQTALIARIQKLAGPLQRDLLEKEFDFTGTKAILARQFADQLEELSKNPNADRRVVKKAMANAAYLAARAGVSGSLTRLMLANATKNMSLPQAPVRIVVLWIMGRVTQWALNAVYGLRVPFYERRSASNLKMGTVVGFHVDSLFSRDAADAEAQEFTLDHTLKRIETFDADQERDRPGDVYVVRSALTDDVAKINALKAAVKNRIRAEAFIKGGRTASNIEAYLVKLTIVVEPFGLIQPQRVLDEVDEIRGSSSGRFEFYTAKPDEVDMNDPVVRFILYAMKAGRNVLPISDLLKGARVILMGA